MVTNFSVPLKGANAGSCRRLVSYLEKEDQGLPLEQQRGFFSCDQDQIRGLEVVASIDANAERQGLKKEQDRFYTFTLDPSQKELSHIASDETKLKAFTRQAMENYAANFQKDLESKDLVWYAKIEHVRTFSREDAAVKEGFAQTGEVKPGEQCHVHVVVSRFEKRSAEQQLSAERTKSLSPLTNHRQTKGVIQGSFTRTDLIQANEKSFDELFGYERKLEEQFAYVKAFKSENQAERLWAKEQALKESLARQKQEELARQAQENQLARTSPQSPTGQVDSGLSR